MQWKPIFDDKYEISNTGKLRHHKRKQILSEVKHNQGYIQYTIFNSKLDKYKTYLAHRLVAKAFLPNPNNYKFINHKNGIKTDNRVENIEWCTRQMNEDHAFATGLKDTKGSNNVFAKLDENKVRWIKQNCNTVDDKKKASKKFDIHIATINRILQGVIWKHVD